MKKILSVLLVVLVALSALSVAAFAVDKTVKFVDGENEVVVQFTVGEGDLSASVPENPTKKSDGKYEYTFKGWQLEGDTSGKLYQKGTIKDPTESDPDTIVYTAVFAQQEIYENQTFWQLVQSIFARINDIFRRLAQVFRFDQ